MIRAILLFLGATLLPLAAAEPVSGWLCVGNPEFLKAAAPLIQHRRGQRNLRVVLSSDPVEKAIAACHPRPAYILILGDDVAAEVEKPEPWQVPAARPPYHGWLDSHPARFASDMARGDFDNDGLPDAAVGRIPARSAEEVAEAAAKILRWENRAPSLSDLSVPVWAGDPGFAPIFRNMALGFLFEQVRRRSPPWAELWVMQSDERSPFCGWPVEQPALFNTRIQQGGLLSAMIGHGLAREWWCMDYGNRRLMYRTADAALMKGGEVSPPHLIFACGCGQFTLERGDCLTEALFRAPGGPVLCVGASEDSHPLTNYYHSSSVLASLEDRDSGFGDLWLRSLKKANATTEPEKEMLVHALEPLMIKKQLNTADLRRDHAALYNIIGDPATRLFAPRKLEAVFTVRDGAWHWSVPSRPAGATLLVQHLSPLPSFALGKPAATRAESLRQLADANAKLTFQTIAEVPAGASWSGITPGPGTLRLVAKTPSALFVAASRMEPAKSPPASREKGSE